MGPTLANPPEYITAADIVALLPLVAGRSWRFDSIRGIRDRAGFCPICALTHELGLTPEANKTSAWHSIGTLLGRPLATQERSEVTGFVNAVDAIFHIQGLSPLRDEITAALGMPPGALP